MLKRNTWHLEPMKIIKLRDKCLFRKSFLTKLSKLQQ